MPNTWEYYNNKIKAGIPYNEVILEARKDFNISPDYSFKEIPINGQDIPFNLERENIIFLIEQKRYKEAKSSLEAMKRTYRTGEHWNFIEMYEYHLHAILVAEENIKLEISKTKGEFNQHTITLVTIIMGAITLLGSANQIFKVESFQEGLQTFFAIVISIMAIIILTFIMNGSFLKK
ncbi:MAG: hypothetical protein KBC12_00770 [Candidatus Pacebacteria bacterium]|nr:hypothetical protein [Candidatus Paceibacterota bacterium]